MERVLILNEQSAWPRENDCLLAWFYPLILTDSLKMDYPFQIVCVQPPPPLRKKSEKGCPLGVSVGEGATVHRLALVWKWPITKFPCPVFLMIAKDCTELCLPLPCPSHRPHYSARLMRFGSRGPSEFFPQIRHRNAFTEIAWEDAEQGLAWQCLP